MLRHNIAPVLEPTLVHELRPDYLVILPWNITAELKQKNAWLAEFSTDFVTAVTRLEVI